MADASLEKLFPAFLEIQDIPLREQAESAMRLAMDTGNWTDETIGQCPVSVNWEGCDVSWVEHVTDVTQSCLALYGQISKYYRRHGVELSRDIVAAGALLHDIGKLTEFTLDGEGRPVHGANYQLMRHPLSGAVIAAKAGLSDRFVHLIATHSFEGDHSYQTPESEFIRTIDLFVFNCSVKGLKKKA